MRSLACHHAVCSTPRPPAEKASQQGEAKAGAPMGTPQGDSENIFPRQANTAICFSCLNYTCYLFFKWSVIIGEWGRHPASQCNQNFDIATYLLTNELFIFGKCASWSPRGWVPHYWVITTHEEGWPGSGEADRVGLFRPSASWLIPPFVYSFKICIGCLLCTGYRSRC